MRQLLFVSHFTSVEEPRFRKVKQFGEGHMTDPDETLVSLQSPCAFRAPWITEGDEWKPQGRQTSLRSEF